MGAILPAPSPERPRRVSILGATGSVGRSTIDLIERQPELFPVEAVTANRNAEQLAQQARRLGARLAVVADPAAYGALKAALAGSGIEAAAGREGLIEAALRPADLVMAAIVGAAGLAPTLAAAGRGAVVALANKESLVCAGELMTRLVLEKGATLLPVDSEHNAIWQVFDFSRPQTVDRIILTASGGPFRCLAREKLGAVTVEQAVAHPTWDMGAKISVDSATMMNKGLETIEAWHLFPVEKRQIEVLVHPQSVIHSLVAYRDGSVLAQLGSPDMRTPIAYCLAWPDRIPTPAKRLDLAAIAQLTFEAPDEHRFPALRLARQALEAGGSAPAILNAANEVAVQAFLDRRLGFTEITDLVEEVLGRLQAPAVASLDDVLAVDGAARRMAGERLAVLAA